MGSIQKEASNRKKLADYKGKIASLQDGANAKKGHKGFISIPEQHHKSKLIVCKVTDIEREMIKQAADIAGVNVSTVIRRALRQYIVDAAYRSDDEELFND